MKQLGLDLEAGGKVEPEQSKEPHVFSVAELNKQIRGTLETKFHLIWLKGELSNFKIHSSGHWYFSLKDERAQVNAVMFRGHNARVKFKPASGMEVLVRGKVTVYEPRGNYQIFCELLEPLGDGALQQQFEELKAKLQSEGLFESSRKRALPKFPRHIAVVTSPTGAAIRDILNVLNRRHSGLKVTVVPTVVQGAAASEQIVKALKLSYRLNDIDAIIVGRGGGSKEDLWCFNDEGVARTLAQSPVPTIAAVGHEIDFTMADFVADLRAPTPSAAAELVCASAVELVEKVEAKERALVRAMSICLRTLKTQVIHLARGLVDPQKRLQDLAQRCDELTQRLEQIVVRGLGDRRQRADLQPRLSRAMRSCLKNEKARVESFMALLDSLSPLKVVERGYSIVSHQGNIVKASSQLKLGDKLSIRFAKGEVEASVEKLKKES